MNSDAILPVDISAVVSSAIKEDIGSGDVTAALVDDNIKAKASVICREHAVVCGVPWFSEVFNQIDRSVRIEFLCQEGETVESGQTICKIQGKARSLLSAERTALNFLQTLSGTATTTRTFVDKISDYGTRILDTRKTIPGLRSAQKYAVRVGGGVNHRIGLYDGVLIKENHQYVSLSMDAAIQKLPVDQPGITLVEIEVENLEQLKAALETGVKRIMLDNFSVEDIAKAVEMNANRVELEASGNITLENIQEVAQTGVDYISVGAITKNLQAIDFSILFE